MSGSGIPLAAAAERTGVDKAAIVIFVVADGRALACGAACSSMFARCRDRGSLVFETNEKENTPSIL